MDKYEKLINFFSDVLEKSKDYHIAYVHYIGYVSLIGLFEGKENQGVSTKIDEVFTTPEKMAESLLRNWRWQWYYENRDKVLNDEILDFGELKINPLKRNVEKNGREIQLTLYEFDILCLLAKNPGWVFSKEQISGMERTILPGIRQCHAHHI